MLTWLKNTTKLDIQNVICFYVGLNTEISSASEVKSKNEKDWTYQDYLTASCDSHQYNLIWLNKATVHYTFINGVINIDDDSTDVHISLDKKNRHNTIILQGQANDDMPVNYEGLMRAFEYMKFYMINTVDEIKIASDKYMSANLLSSNNLPQPKYVLVTKDLMMDSEKHYNNTRESFWEILDKIYDKNSSIDKGSEKKYVCKILGGSLGIGVFICKRTEIESILQTMFTVDPNIQFIIQEFKENTGDIRVHLFSVDGVNYEVLACMKRNKIDKDFRSNVSLGATTDKYELSDEQKEIVLKTAYISGCRWVGVDLMECNDGSNVIIEYNSSPGVQGISQQIGKNMFDIVFDKISEYLSKYAKYGKMSKEELLDSQAHDCLTVFDPKVVKSLKEDVWDNLSHKRRKVLNKCLSCQPGQYYQLNGKSDPKNGLDCSGWIKWIFKEALDVDVPGSCPKYFRWYEDNSFEKIDKKDLRPGDIGVKNDSTILNHCGIYAGDGKWFDTSLMYGVQLSNYDKFKYFFRIKEIDS